MFEKRKLVAAEGEEKQNVSALETPSDSEHEGPGVEDFSQAQAELMQSADLQSQQDSAAADAIVAKLTGKNTGVEKNLPADRSADKVESQSKLSKVLGALTLAAAALGGGMGNAEAGGANTLEVNSPQVNRIKQELRQSGVKNFEIIQSVGLTIKTEQGKVKLGAVSADNLDEILSGVTAQAFLKEIKRQNNTETRIIDEVNTAHGTFRVDISPYAQAIFQENNISYKDGKITNGRQTVDLTGSNDTNPNSECKITGGEDFKNFVIADCLELKIKNGKPTISSVKYQIDGSDLRVVEIKK